MLKNRWIRIAFFLVIFTVMNRVLRSFGGNHEDSPETAAVRQEVVQDVGCSQARVSLIQGDGLFVTVVNPPWDGLSPDDLNAKMKQAALGAYEAYPLRDHLTLVDINYEKRTDYLVAVFPKFVTSESFHIKDLVPDATPTPGF